MPRKTVNVQVLKDHANSLLKSPNELFPMEYKAGVCTLLEKSLHLSGNYQGFGFIDPDDSEVNTPGYYNRYYY